ncbi:FCD domain-containing protein, partial [Synergistes jonesii]|uniref:FCD domain-containing protein n=1 Tax=Synergistes jonesii TaxID=2754 RepID=UPI00248EAEFA
QSPDFKYIPIVRLFGKVLFDGFYKPSDIVIEHQTPAQHREIIAAIKERDVKKARSAMKRHIYTTYTKLLLPQGIEKN